MNWWAVANKLEVENETTHNVQQLLAEEENNNSQVLTVSNQKNQEQNHKPK